jgi:hypothetical protein
MIPATNRREQAVYRMFSLPGAVSQVLGAALNRSESRRRAASPSMMPAQAPDFTYSCQRPLHNRGDGKPIPGGPLSSQCGVT